MIEVLDRITTGIVIVELVVAVWLGWANWREIRFLDRVEPMLPSDEDVPLFHALRRRARYITFVGVWLLGLTVLGAFGVQLAMHFPPLRAINGALLLGLLAGPLVTGRALRQRVSQRQAQMDAEV